MWPWPVCIFPLDEPCAEAVHRETYYAFSAAARSMQAFPVYPGRPLRLSGEVLWVFISADCRGPFSPPLGPLPSFLSSSLQSDA
jgi:hypothetical protein